MGYQLYMLRLCVACLLSPYHGKNVFGSTVTSGGRALMQFHTPAILLQLLGGAPFTSSGGPLPFRSAGCWRIKIAFGLISLVTPFAEFGMARSRANPNANHSPVIGW